MRKPTALLCALLLISACQKGQEAAAVSSSGAATTPAAPTTALQDEPGIVIHLRGGGQHPQRFCMPEWSIANRSSVDIGALLLELEWRERDGTLLEAAGTYGSIIEPFRAGQMKKLTLNGYSTACSDLVLKVGRYACRDTNAVRIPCPGPIRADAAGGPQLDLGDTTEGPMRGAVEVRH